MSAAARRVQLAPAYLLHHRPYRESGRILEVLVRAEGRLTLFARGVSGPKSRLAALLQPFQPLLLSFTQGREAGQLTGAECAAPAAPLPAASVMSAFYLNELLLKLTLRHDAAPELFDAYADTLGRLRAGEVIEGVLRRFELELLSAVGYGLDLATEVGGQAIESEGFYRFRPAQGLYRVAGEEPGALAGHSLQALQRGDLEAARTRADARVLLAAALAECLEGRELATRRVARALKQGSHPAARYGKMPP
ncbi:MAG: DNA repair protein RecO [Steroidobacteraceae bacterium]